MSLPKSEQEKIHEIIRPLSWFKTQRGTEIALSIALFSIGPILFCLLRWPKSLGEWMLVLLFGIGFLFAGIALHAKKEMKTLKKSVSDFHAAFPLKESTLREAAIEYLHQLAKNNYSAYLVAASFPRLTTETEHQEPTRQEEYNAHPIRKQDNIPLRILAVSQSENEVLPSTVIPLKISSPKEESPPPPPPPLLRIEKS